MPKMPKVPKMPKIMVLFVIWDLLFVYWYIRDRCFIDELVWFFHQGVSGSERWLIGQNSLNFFSQLVHIKRLLDESVAAALQYFGGLTVDAVAA